jgi:hypothetical protein
MIQIALLLFGVEFTRSRARLLGVVGFIWGALGVAVMIDGLDGNLYFPLRIFGLLLLLESLVTLSVASSGMGAQRAVLYFKGGICFFVATLILSDKVYSNLLLAIVFGFTYFVMGVLVITCACVVRYLHWRSSLISGGAQIVFALLLVIPYPIDYNATVLFFLGSLMIVGGLDMVRLSRRARRLREGASTFDLLAPGDLLTDLLNASPEEPWEANYVSGEPLVVHIWTPEGTSGATTVPRPIINRYIAAVDAEGVISTGHAAIELASGLYISLYPASDIDRSPSEFLRLLKATRDNDVPGMFLSDYATEVASWCDSDRRILFHEYNIAALMRFWAKYRQETTYNLTYRNCSSSVAYALEAAMDGVLSSRGRQWRSTLRTVLMPELWIAAHIRKRALTMAWTPGLVMDYARALGAIVHPAPLSWVQRLPWRGLRVHTLPNDLGG